MHARRLAEIYAEQNPAEHPRHVAERNPTIDLDALWTDNARIMHNWLARLRQGPDKTLATAKWTWAGKVTRAYFAMIGQPLPKRKSDMVAIVNARIAAGEPC